MNKQVSFLDDSFEEAEHITEASQVDDIGRPEAEVSYRLHTLEVFKWGPFGGLHRIEFDEAATAIIGSTGSGKTTLVDALMTLLSALRQATNDQQVEIGVIESEIGKCQSRLTEANEGVGSGLTKEEQELAGKNVKLPDKLRLQQ